MSQNQEMEITKKDEEVNCKEVETKHKEETQIFNRDMMNPPIEVEGKEVKELGGGYKGRKKTI